MTYPRFLARTALSGLLTTTAFGAAAQEADFFKGKTLSVNIGYEAGSTYDLYARLLADHIGRFLPGKPNIIARNMPGAGSLRVASFIYKAAPKDGTAWGAISRDVATEPLLYGTKSKAAFKDPLELTWIGSLNTEVGVTAVWHTTGVKTWEEARSRPIIVAMSSSQGGISARAVNSLLHAKFQQVCCYGGGNLQNFAMERGEVEARVGWSWSSLKATKMDWLESGKINLLMQIGLKKNPDIPANVPLVLDLAPTEKDKKALRIIFSNQSMGRPYIMPPGVPAARVAIVREAFMNMVKDKAFLAAAEKKKLEINDPQSGKAVEEVLREVYASPADAIAAARHAITSGEIKMVRQPKKKKKKKKTE
jgi:tripartite-type tricarboxylate transporter receptor subunit TctC